MDAAALAELWYDVVEGSDLWQGDIIRNLLAYAFPQDLPILDAPPAPDAELPVKAEWEVNDWIVMSASCDLDRALDKYPFVLVCRVWPASAARLGVSKPGKLEQQREVIRKGYDPLRFLLAEHPAEPHLDLSFAEFRPHLTLPREYLRRACVGKRLRLKPPYREWFGNWVGANFSRVGIDDDAQITKFIEEGEPSASARIEASGRDVTPFKPTPATGQPATATAGANVSSLWPAWVLRAVRAVKKALFGQS